MKVTTQRTSKKLKLMHALSVLGMILGVALAFSGIENWMALGIVLGIASTGLWLLSRILIWWHHS